MALFIAVPAIYEPFNYIFIFGGFDSSVPTALFTLGMIRMVHNTLDDYVGEPQEATPLYRGHIAEPEHALAGANR